MTAVGLMVVNSPRTMVGRMVSMNANTTETAKRKPKVPSLTRLSICLWMSGPWSLTTMMLTSSGMPVMVSRVSFTTVVTSRVLASGPFVTDTESPGCPLMREMLEGRAEPKETVATSDSRTGPDSLAAMTRL